MLRVLGVCEQEITVIAHEIYMANYTRALSPDNIGTIYEDTCKAYRRKLLLSLKEKHRKRRSKELVTDNWGQQVPNFTFFSSVDYRVSGKK